MARTVKKKKELTIEEKLAEALVPADEQSNKVPENWCWTYLTKGFAECKDSFRKPINATEKEIEVAKRLFVDGYLPGPL